MLPLALISFREFFEAWLIIGVFLGISKQFNLKREPEIFLAVIVGMLIALIIPITVFIFGSRLQSLWNENNIDIIESILMLITSLAIAFVVLSLHRFFQNSRQIALQKITSRLKEHSFDVALFTAIMLAIVREGLEVGLFALSIVLATPSHVLFMGLGSGFVVAGLVGLLATILYKRIPTNKIFVITEYAIMFIGAALFKNGVTKLLEHGFNFDIAKIIPLPLTFLGDKSENMVSHFLNTMLGVESEFSLLKLALLAAYIGLVYYFVFSKSRSTKIA